MKPSKQRFYEMAIAFIFICLVLFPPARGNSAEESSSPTIEDLTQGKVKIGDIVDKKNIEIIKEYLPLGISELVNKGMVLKMGKNLPPEETLPNFFAQATERNKGHAILDDHKCVYVKDGSLWPGGLPFSEPKTGEEVMANFKYGTPMDDYHIAPFRMAYINKEGEIYKSSCMDIRYLYTTGRLKVSPVGVIPGEEEVRLKCLALFTDPFDLKGLGQINIRYYDEVKKPDAGFAYLPAFKRVIRISATTYQDNMGGSDFTWGDQEGLREPFFTYWSFKLLEKKNMLMPACLGPASLIGPDGYPSSDVKFTEGHKFPISDWAVVPVYTVECLPKIKHIYSKKVLYIQALPYWAATGQVLEAAIYDRQGRLWKIYSPLVFHTRIIDGDSYMLPNIILMHDIQTGHTTQEWYQITPQNGYKPDEVTLGDLIKRGR